jgi:maltose phosphorylase
MAKKATRYLVTDPWSITEHGFHPEHSRVSESIFSLANEYMGVRGYFEEGFSGDQLRGSYLNGVWSEIDIRHAVSYKGLATQWTFMVNSVDWLHTRIRLDGETLDLALSSFTAFERKLDLRKGLLTRQFTWITKTNKKLRIRFTRFTSMARQNLGGQQISLEALNFSGPVEIDSGLDFSPKHESIGNRNYWEVVQKMQSQPWKAIMGKCERSNIHLFAASRLELPAQSAGNLFCRAKLYGEKMILDLETRKTKKINKLVVLYSDKNTSGNKDYVWNEGMHICKDIEHISFDQAIEEHTSRWEHVWDDLDIVIEGDPGNQQGIRYCLFQLYQTNRGLDPANNVGAKGLTGEIYSGHTFWDTEAYCLPFYLFTNPEAAKNLLLFRHKTLEEARTWSIEQNCLGACYPMETIDGRESCPVWWHGNLEIHVSGAVGYGIWHYYNITGDEAFLAHQGIEMLIEICRFYASRGDWRHDGYGFYGVMGPDEFHTFVNNNYYTNLLAKKLFQFTIKMLHLARWDLITAQPPGNEEVSDWEQMADRMILPENKKTGIIEQHEGYFLLPHIDIHAIPVEEFPLYHHWTLPRIYRYDMIKQPDVLLSLLFFNQDYSRHQKKVNYLYYESRCIHESSLSPAVHSILANELGMTDEAAGFFEYATRLDLDNYNRNTGEGLHITSMAASWLNIVYGFAGMRSDGPILSFAPTIPAHWQAYEFRIRYKEARITVRVTQEKTVFTAETGAKPVTIQVNQQTIRLHEEPFEMKTILSNKEQCPGKHISST